MSDDLISRRDIYEKLIYDTDQTISLGSGIAHVAMWRIADAIKAAPAVDAVPVVHGRWEFEVTKEFGCRYHNFAVKAKCSECGKVRPAWYGAFPHLDDEEAELAALVNAAVQKHPKFCEECGAKMDGGNDG